METELKITKERAKTPRAAAIAGIVFSVLLITALVLIRISIPANPLDAGDWLARRWKTISFAISLVPFAGIAFLWFIGVMRDKLGEREDRFFATVFLGSGLLFLALLFTTTAIISALIRLYGTSPDILIASQVYPFGRTLAFELMNVYTMKMAGVFMISTCTLALRTGFLPIWITYLGYGLAVVLILALGFFPWASLAFPIWVLVVSIHVLIANYRKGNISTSSGTIK